MMPLPAGTSRSWRMPTQPPRPPRSGYWPCCSSRTPARPGCWGDVAGQVRAVRARASLTGQFASVDEDPTGAENLVMIAACSVIRGGAPRRGPVSCARRSAWPRRPACQDVLGRYVPAAGHRGGAALPASQRIAITLMDLRGFTATQVAAITGAPRGTVPARVHRGRKTLALSLAGQRQPARPPGVPR